MLEFTPNDECLWKYKSARKETTHNINANQTLHAYVLIKANGATLNTYTPLRLFVKPGKRSTIRAAQIKLFVQS